MIDIFNRILIEIPVIAYDVQYPYSHIIPVAIVIVVAEVESTSKNHD
jgi:hypothetical protein